MSKKWPWTAPPLDEQYKKRGRRGRYPKHELNDRRWQKLRLEVLSAHNFECDDCKALGWAQKQEERLEVHHIRYLNGHHLWEYPVSNFAVLCQFHHKARHGKNFTIRRRK